jgi:hypothetical protein
MLGCLGMIPHNLTMIPGFGRTGFGRYNLPIHIYIYTHIFGFTANEHETRFEDLVSNLPQIYLDPLIPFTSHNNPKKNPINVNVRYPGKPFTFHKTSMVSRSSLPVTLAQLIHCSVRCYEDRDHLEMAMKQTMEKGWLNHGNMVVQDGLIWFNMVL